jgi:hypothetical protein
LISPVGLVKPFLTLMRGSDPTSLPRKPWRSPPCPTNGSRQQEEAGCAAVSNENPEGASEEGKDCSLHFSLLQFLHVMKQVAVRKKEG